MRNYILNVVRAALNLTNDPVEREDALLTAVEVFLGCPCTCGDPDNYEPCDYEEAYDHLRATFEWCKEQV